MEQRATIRTEGGRRFTKLSWGKLGLDASCQYGLLAGGLQDGVVSLWNPQTILNSNGTDPGLVHTQSVHKGDVHCVEFHPLKPNLLATCGSDSEVKIVNFDNPAAPSIFEPSTTNKHQGSEVLCCAWNRIVPHILCSCSNTGTTVVWDLKQKKEVISFQDPASRLRCASVAWHPEVPTQLLLCYDDDRQPSIQMWDLRNCQYPFKETAPHTKGVLSVAWNQMDPNLILSCGKDNRLICTSIASGSPETWCDLSAQQNCFEVQWAPHKPSLFTAASYSGTVNLYSVQGQQSAGNRYCPKWYRKSCGASFGFGGKLLSFGAKAESNPPASFCHSLVVPSEPEIVPTADVFEHWIAERRLREYCLDKTRSCGGVASQEGLMWELMATLAEEEGRTRVPTLLGFDQDRILQEAERLLGAKPGQLLGASPEEPAAAAPPTPSLGPELDLTQAESFFDELSASTEQKKKDEMEREEQKKKEEALGLSTKGKTTDWSSGPEALIKQSLLVGNLTAAVELCFKSGKMAEALLLASGGGITLWTRARDEYLRLQGDTFLTTVGNIMTNDFSKMVANSNLAHWMETLAILATYSAREYQALCEQLAERLEKEKFDIRSALICYICAKNFPKTVSIWAITHVASQGSQNLALQDLVEKMAVLQDVTKFQQSDALFSQKLTKYAEILANSGRLTAAMRYLCLLPDDNSSATLRDRIFNSAPAQMGQMLRSAPRFPFQTTDVRASAVVPQAPKMPATGAKAAPVPGKAPGAQMGGQMPGPGGAWPMQPKSMPHSGMGPGPGPMPGQPGPGVGVGPGGMAPGPMPHMGPCPGQPGPCPGACGPQGPGPCPGGCGGCGPNPCGPNPCNPSMGVPGPGVGPIPGGGGGMGCGGPIPGGCGGCGGMGPGPVPGGVPGPCGPVPGGGWPAKPAAPAAPVPPGKSTAPTASAMPVTDGMPVAWPLPTKAMQKLSTNQSVADANMAIQEMSSGGSAVIGEPLPPHDLAHVKNVFTLLLDSSQDNNPKKREDVLKKLEELYTKLQTGQLKTATSQKVLQLAKAMEAQDYATAQKVQQELSVDWDTNKSWLMGVKRLITTR